MAQSTKLCQTIVLALILLVSVATAGRISRLYRTAREAETSTTETSPIETSSTESTPSKNCQNNTPCGWAIYTPFTRKVDYFMANTCVCPKDKNMVCLKTDDDLSISAYVYRCRQLNATATN